MAGAAMPGRCWRERSPPVSAIECLCMRRACAREPAKRYSCARRWHCAGDTDDMCGRSMALVSGASSQVLDLNGFVRAYRVARRAFK